MLMIRCDWSGSGSAVDVGWELNLMNARLAFVIAICQSNTLAEMLLYTRRIAG